MRTDEVMNELDRVLRQYTGSFKFAVEIDGKLYDPDDLTVRIDDQTAVLGFSTVKINETRSES